MSLNPAHGEVYLIQHYVITFVSDLRQVCGFPRILRFPPPIKLTAMIKTEILLKVTLKTVSKTEPYCSSCVIFFIVKFFNGRDISPHAGTYLLFYMSLEIASYIGFFSLRHAFIYDQFFF